MNPTKSHHHHVSNTSSTSPMGSSSSHSTTTNRREQVCRCGEKPILMTSWTDDNPSRRFFSCRNYFEGHSCTYFRWFDDDICDCGKVIIPQLRNENMKMKEEVLKMKEELIKLREQNVSLMAESMKLKDDEVEMEVRLVEMNNEKLKLMDENHLLRSKLKTMAVTENWFYVASGCGLLALVICVFVYISKGHGNICQVGLKGLPF